MARFPKKMMIRKLLYFGCAFFLLCVEPAGFSGCIKEYSYEGGPLQDTVHDSIPFDTFPGQAIVFPVCTECKNPDDSSTSEWNFKYDTSFLCGNITAAIIAPDRNGFTFFGPSACSTDTGLVMTVYLGAYFLDTDKLNITTNKVIFEYYDNVAPSDIFITAELAGFSLTIDTYEYATGIAKGRFSGYVPAKNGGLVQIKNGEFRVKFN